MMDKRAVQRWRRTAFRAIQSIDRRWLPSCPAFSAAMVMAAIDVIGTDVAALVTLTGFSAAYVTRVLKRLRKARLVEGHTVRVGWDHERTGSVAFVADALIAAGFVTRTPDPARSAAAKARVVTRPATRRARAPVAPGAVFTPQRVRSDPRYIALKDQPPADDVERT